MHSVFLRWGGIVLMVIGLSLRYWAAKTLGTFYTRTLQVIERQRMLDQGSYAIVRHPGYFGLLLLEIGAGLAIANWIMLVLLIAIGILSKLYRIHVEEDMLKLAFGDDYTIYAKKTWMLVPFVY